MENPTNPITGRWQQPAGQPYAGLIFDFSEDGTFKAEYAEMGVTSSGTFIVSDDLIYLDQKQHTFGLIGKFEGRYRVDSDLLLMSMGDVGEKAPADLSKARTYKKQ
jgi:hypothetical protein